jgi:hypothetical protein
MPGGWRAVAPKVRGACVSADSPHLRYHQTLLASEAKGRGIMAEITAEAVRALREITDLPMMECKKALTEAAGDQEKAIAILRERVKGLSVKFKDRVTASRR